MISRSINFVVTALISFFTSAAIAQTTITVNFDTIPANSVIADQYLSQGITISGSPIAIDAILNGITPVSAPNIAFAVTGTIDFSLNIADVKTVSAYLTGPEHVGIYAYDSADNLVGQAMIPPMAPSNTLVSVTSSTNPITKVLIHNGGSEFLVDDVSFTTAPPPPPPLTCRDIAKELYDAIVALPKSAFKCPPLVTLDRNRLLKEVNNFEKLRAARASQKKLLDALSILQRDITKTIVPASASSLLDKVNQLITKTKANACY